MEPTDKSDKQSKAGERSERDFRGVVELVIRLLVLFGVVAWCLMIVAPFAGIVLWALIIALAVDTPYQRLAAVLGGRRGLTAFLFVLFGFALMVVPALLLSETLVTGAQWFARAVSSGELAIPAAPEKVQSWPVIGPPLYDVWHLANENLGEALSKLGPQLETLSRGLLGAAGAAGVAMLQLAASLLIAGFLLSKSKGRDDATNRIAKRLAGPRGGEFVGLAVATIQSVVQGIVGVAVIQALLAGLGFVAAGVSAAGVWALLVLIAAIVQLPVALVLITPVLLVFSNESTGVSLAFTVWCMFVGLVDNVLKPILFGRGAKVPTVVIFLGAIGGMLSMGIIGLFLGAVVLAVGYELFIAWLVGEDAAPAATATRV